MAVAYTRTHTTACPGALLTAINDDPTITQLCLQVVENGTADIQIVFQNVITAGEETALDNVIATYICPVLEEPVDAYYVEPFGSPVVEGNSLWSGDRITYELANIDHLDLANIGTNSHADIDSHIADTNNPHGTTVNNLTDTTITTPAVNDALTWNGSQWVNTAVAVSDEKVKQSITDTTPGFLNQKLGAGTAVNFTVTNPSGNEILIINVDETALTITESQISDLQNYALADHVHILDELTDVNVSGSPAPVEGDLLVFNNANEWVNSYNVSDFASQTTLDELNEASGDPTGFFNRNDSTISFDNATRTVTIAPIVDSFDVYVIGEKFTFTTPQTFQIPDVSGIHLVIFDNTGTLTELPFSFTEEQLLSLNAFTALIYWNSAQQEAVFVGDERHGISMAWTTHRHFHHNFGAQYHGGLKLSNFTIGDGTLQSHAQFDCSAGSIWDEDIWLKVVNTGDSTSPIENEQDLSPILRIPVMFKDGTEVEIRPADDFPFIHPGDASSYVATNGRIPYNDLDTGTLVEALNGQYIFSHIVMTNSINQPLISMQGIAAYDTIEEAVNSAPGEVVEVNKNLNISPELFTVASVLYQTQSADVDPPGAHVVQLPNGENYIDWTKTFVNQSIRGRYDAHGTLIDLDQDHHIQYLLIDGTRGMTGDLSLTSNDIISVGLVDGRDVSVDGTNLDNHIADTNNPHSTSILNLTDTTITSATNGQVLTWNGTVWVNQTLPVDPDELVKVSANDTTAGYLDGKLAAGANITFQVINEGGNEQLRIDATGAGGASLLDELTDVVFTGSPVTDQVLAYDGTNWTNTTLPGGSTDELIKVSANDTTAGYLNGKIVAGSTGITITETNNGGDETLTIDLGDHVHDVSEIFATGSPAPNIGDILEWDGTNWIVAPNNNTVTDLHGGIPAITSNSLIPLTTTVPLITDGTPIWTQVVTPQTIDNEFEITSSLAFQVSKASSSIIIALFRDNVCVGTMSDNATNNNKFQTVSFTIHDIPGTTNQVTYQCRFGVTANATWYVNQDSGGTNLGGTLENNSYMILEKEPKI